MRLLQRCHAPNPAARDTPRRSINERDAPESVADPKPESEHNTHAEAINTHTEINIMTGDSNHYTNMIIQKQH